MTLVVLLDSSPLSLIAHPLVTPDAEECRRWSRELTKKQARIVIPEITDYEVRRELLRAGKAAGVGRLNQLQSVFFYEPISTDAMRIGAEFWAELRGRGQATAGDRNIDCDVILAAQAELILRQGYEVVVATTNTKHLSRLVPADHWLNIT
jgi:predicted nucleic acid-binding protein